MQDDHTTNLHLRGGKLVSLKFVNSSTFENKGIVSCSLCVQGRLLFNADRGIHRLRGANGEGVTEVRGLEEVIVVPSIDSPRGS